MCSERNLTSLRCFPSKSPNESLQPNCNMPKGNCGRSYRDDKLHYRCVQGDWPTKTVNSDKNIDELE